MWYEPMDHLEAAEKWSAATYEHPDVGWGINDNPFTTPVDVFRFPKEECEEVVHGGYTHKDGPRLIGILIEQSGEQVFGSIAHECVHVQQDDIKGPGCGWRTWPQRRRKRGNTKNKSHRGFEATESPCSLARAIRKCSYRAPLLKVAHRGVSRWLI